MKKAASPTHRPPNADTVLPPEPAEEPLGATDHYKREKARRARLAEPDSEAMASARREYRAMLETNAAKGRGGRPKKPAVPRAPADDALEENDPDGE